MSDSDDPSNPKPDLESLEKHIQLDGREPTKPYEGPYRADSEVPPSLPPVAPPPSDLPPVSDGSPPAPKSLGPVKQFYRDLMDCLTEPCYFFEKRYPEINLTYALTFGIVVSWIAAFLDWLTRIVRHETLFDGLMKMRDKLHELPLWKTLPDNFWAQSTDHATSGIPAWMAELIGIALSPFQSLLGFCVSGIVLFVGAYLLVPKKTDLDQDPVDITHLIKIVCFTSTPHLIASILGFLPLSMGAFIAWVYGVALLMIALSQRYKISNLRAGAVILLPAVVGVFVASCLIGGLLAILFGVFASLFHS